MKMLVKKGPKAYKAFRLALEESHQFLADQLDNTDVSEDFLSKENIGV